MEWNVTMVAFLLDNPVSDLSNPDCLDFHVRWNKNLKKDRPVSFIILDPSAKGLFLSVCLLFGF